MVDPLFQSKLIMEENSK